ncbi:hypothetical protein ACHWQZ_G011541 [Mnemiopsis leidyi]
MMYQISTAPQFYAPPPPLISPEFTRVLYPPPPPPYQEDLPKNHTYKSGTRISPPHKLVLQIPHITQQTPNLDSTYEHAYCHNLILPRPGVCLKKSSDLETSPVSSKIGKVRTKNLWRNLVRKVRRRRQSAASKPCLRNSDFRQRCRSLSSGNSNHVIQTPVPHESHLIDTVQSRSKTDVTSRVKPSTPPPRGIVKPPRQLKNLSSNSSSSPDLSHDPSPSDKDSSNSLNKIKKSVSFSNIRTSSLVPARANEKGVMFESYVLNGYVFTKL